MLAGVLASVLVLDLEISLLLSISAAVYRYHQLCLNVLVLASAVAVFLYQSLIKALVPTHSVGWLQRANAVSTAD